MPKRLLDLFSEDSRMSSEKAREAVKKQRMEDIEKIKIAQNSHILDLMKKVTLKYPFIDQAKGFNKLNKHGLLVIKSADLKKELLGNVIDICQKLEEKILARLDKLGIQYQGFSTFNKWEITKLNENEKLRSFRFKELSSRCLGRLDIKISSKLDIDEQYSKIWMDTIKLTLGEDFKLAYQGLICSFPGSLNQPFHGDGPHLFGNSQQLPIHAINVFVPLHDITLELGPTEFFIGSNSLKTAATLDKCLSSFTSLSQSTTTELRTKCSSLNPLLMPIQPLLIANRDVLLYDYRTVHRGTANTSLSTTRRVLYLLYTKPWFNDHINFGEVSIFEDDNVCLQSISQQQQNCIEEDAGACRFSNM